MSLIDADDNMVYDVISVNIFGNKHAVSRS